MPFTELMRRTGRARTASHFAQVGSGLISLAILVLAHMCGGVPNATAGIPANAFYSGPGIPVQGLGGYCYAYSSGSGYVEVYVEAYDPQGTFLTWAYGAGQYGAEAYGTYNLTMTGQYRCEADYWDDGWYMGHSTSGFTFRLMVYDVTLKTFIPENNYIDPTDHAETAEGDDRGFDRYGSARTIHFMALFDPHASSSISLFADGPYKDTAMSADYEVTTSLDGNGRLTNEARNDWVAGPPLKIRWAFGDGGSSMYCTTPHDSAEHMQLQCHASESTPLHPWVGVLFDISYDFYIDFWVEWQDAYSGTVDYLVQGGHDGFPNYEIYVGNQAVFLYDHRWDGQEIWSLGPPEEYSGFFIPGSLQ